MLVSPFENELLKMVLFPPFFKSLIAISNPNLMHGKFFRSTESSSFILAQTSLSFWSTLSMGSLLNPFMGEHSPMPKIKGLSEFHSLINQVGLSFKTPLLVPLGSLNLSRYEQNSAFNIY